MSSLSDRKLMRRTEEITLAPIRPSAAIQARLQKRITRLVVEMNNSVVRWVKAQWNRNEPELAKDERKSFPEAPPWSIPKNFTGVALNRGHTVSGPQQKWWAYYRRSPLKGKSGNVRQFSSRESAEAALQLYIDQNVPADDLDKIVKDLRKRWQRKFDEMSEKFADHFAEDVEDRVSSNLKTAMRDAGWTINKKVFAELTPEQQDVVRATINESVSLIKSIPSKYFDQVESAVQRSVQYGRDLGRLSKDLQKQYGVSKRRAAFIARDQNNKATAAITRVRQIQLGITEAIWVHSSAGKTPRPSHVAAGKRKVRYDPSKGWYDPDENRYIFPGELINCRCFSRSVIPGFAP